MKILLLREKKKIKIKKSPKNNKYEMIRYWNRNKNW